MDDQPKITISTAILIAILFMCAGFFFGRMLTEWDHERNLIFDGSRLDKGEPQPQRVDEMTELSDQVHRIEELEAKKRRILEDMAREQRERRGEAR